MIQTLANSKAVFLADGPRHEKKRQGIKRCGRGCSSSNQAWLETQMSFKEPLLVVILSRKNKTKRHLDATDTHSNQSLQSLEDSLSQNSKDTVLLLFFKGTTAVLP